MSVDAFVKIAFTSAVVDDDVPVRRLRPTAELVRGVKQWRAVHQSLSEDLGPEDAARYTVPFGGVFHHFDLGYLSASPHAFLGRCVRAVHDLPRHAVIGYYPGYAYTPAAHRAHLRRLRLSRYERWIRSKYTLTLDVHGCVGDAPVDAVVYDSAEDDEIVRVDGTDSRVPTFSKPFEYLLYLNESSSAPPNVAFVTTPTQIVLFAVTTRAVKADEELTAFYGHRHSRAGYAAVEPDPGEISAVMAKAHKLAKIPERSHDPRYREAAARYSQLFV